jgi:hypothetical protein
MPVQPPKTPETTQPKKEEKPAPQPQRNLPGVVGDPNHPTDPGHREFERSPSPSRSPEFQQPDSPVEIEQPKALAPGAGAHPKSPTLRSGLGSYPGKTADRLLSLN